jgi:glycosyltransferase involved in cell wall biosynthesis
MLTPKPLLINTFDTDKGGAARATYNLHKGLQGIGVESRMLLQSKTGDDPSVLGPGTTQGQILATLRPYFDMLPLLRYAKRQRVAFSPAVVPEKAWATIAQLNPDVIHLNWIAGGFLRIETLRRFDKPVIWSLYDSWAFTGGCHIPASCTRYRQSCGACPLLGSNNRHDLSFCVWRRKARSWRDLDLTVVAPSRWLADCARASSLFRNVRVEVIPHVLDTNRFRPIDKPLARNLLGLPQDKKLILFGAIKSTSDPNKGFHLLQGAIRELARTGWANRSEVVVFGASEPSQAPDLGLKVRFVGRLYDDVALALLYASADVMVVPSLQESLGLTALEAMACGTPVVAFGATGLLDTVEHRQTGYLAHPYEIDDLASGIAWVLGDDRRWQELSCKARVKVERDFQVSHVAKQYLSIYEDVIRNHEPSVTTSRRKAR